MEVLRNLVILLVMLLCLFGPMVIFAFVGNRAIESLGKRPSQGGRVMMGLILKLVITALVLIGLLILLLASFGPKE
jgi:F0F1-type ATP synthase membrane subunit c/vacuolar-type H+-ATPase subunit K